MDVVDLLLEGKSDIELKDKVFHSANALCSSPSNSHAQQLVLASFPCRHHFPAASFGRVWERGNFVLFHSLASR